MPKHPWPWAFRNVNGQGLILAGEPAQRAHSPQTAAEVINAIKALWRAKMSLRESYAQALFIVQNLDPAQLQQLQGICQEVRIAQNSLRSAAGDLLVRCRDNCEGLCCRNIEIDTIINHWDFVFILASGGTSPDRMVKCLEKENPLFRSDCIFLQDGRGPCLFPADTRPEVCLTTFCDDTSPIAKEIRKLKWAFLKINRFVLRNRPILLLRSIFSPKKGLL